MKILTAQTADGSGSSYPVTANFSAFAYGTFDTCTVTIEVSPDNTNWLTAKDEQGNDVAFTAKGQADVSYSNGSMQYVRATVSSVGAGTDVNAGVTTESVIK